MRDKPGTWHPISDAEMEEVNHEIIQHGSNAYQVVKLTVTDMDDTLENFEDYSRVELEEIIREWRDGLQTAINAV